MEMVPMMVEQGFRCIAVVFDVWGIAQLVKGSITTAKGFVQETALPTTTKSEANGAAIEANGAATEANGAATEANGAVTEANGSATKANGVATEVNGTVTAS
jgi:4-hydroxy-2-oxoheptanedioate aldolase